MSHICQTSEMTYTVSGGALINSTHSNQSPQPLWLELISIPHGIPVFQKVFDFLHPKMMRSINVSNDILKKYN